MSAQDETLDLYQRLMNINAQAQVFRVARKVGLFDRLQRGQATGDQLVEQLNLEPRLARLLIDALVGMKVVEQYGEDYALAAVTRLLCEYDQDLGDGYWQRLVDRLTESTGSDSEEAPETAPSESWQAYFDAAAATQWVHTGAAKQATEILDIGGERQGRTILDLGCGSAVWSAAMAFADPHVEVTGIDLPQRLTAAKRTIDSIGLAPRYQLIGDDPLNCPLEPQSFDMVLLAGRLSGHSPEGDLAIFQRARDALKVGGELVVIDLFRGPGGPHMTEAIEALTLASRTTAGHIRDAEQMRQMLRQHGFTACQFAFLAASRQGFGLLVAAKAEPTDSNSGGGRD